MNPASGNAERILVVRNKFIGDTVLAVPYLRNLREAMPSARIDVLVAPLAGDVLANCPYIDERIYWQRRAGKPRPGVWMGLWPMAKELRRRRYTRCHLLRRSFDVALLAFLAGIPCRVGHRGQGRRWLLSRSIPMPDRHEVERFLAILEADGITVGDTSNEGWTDPAADAAVEAAWPGSDRPAAFICGKSSHPAKDLPAGQLAQVARWLIEEEGYALHLCDAPSHADYYAEVLAGLSPESRKHVHDWSRELSLKAAFSLFSRMDLVVGVDTGLLHMAACFKVPTVALFGSVEPRHWHPWDCPHTVIRAPERADGSRVVGDIGLEQIQSATQALKSAPS
jgi:heptosyltransferase-2